MIVLGINAYHGDSAACIVCDGKLVAAVEEERFRRIKHWAGFPSESIRFCLSAAGVSLDDVGHLAVNSDPRASIWRKIAYTMVHRPNPLLIWQRLQHRHRRDDLDAVFHRELGNGGFHGEVHRIEHHLAHLVSCFHVSPFADAAVASVDGFGDFASAAWGLGQGSRVRVEDRVLFPHSLGIFYQALTQYLGFPQYGDEYKVMGLASYGEPCFLSQLEEVITSRNDGGFELNLKYFRHHRDSFEYRWENGAPIIGNLFTAALEDLLGPARNPGKCLQRRHKDIARSVQTVYENAFFHLLNKLHEKYATENLALAGGCAMNSVANGRVYHRTPFKRMYVQPAAGDAGGAIGAAFAVVERLDAGNGRFHMDHAYWGPDYDESQVERELERRGNELGQAGCVVVRISAESELCRKTASAVADGQVVGWFQGRMEWGPRALGNRSIVCDPRRGDMKEILNHKIKRRESFRPFAPSVLREAVAEWFVTDDDVPFMMKVFQIRNDKRERIPAVTHVDGSGRLQTVAPDTNPRFYGLIKAFQRLSGIPMVLNTSFNENEPIVCNPSEALDCFLRTRMDALVLGNRFISRQS